MATSAEIEIDWNQPFPHLPGAPIVEAVIHWQAVAGRKWEPDQIRAELVSRLPEYPNIGRQDETVIMIAGSMGDGAAVPSTSQRVGWQGFRLSNADKTYVAQFKRNGLSVSRMKPYQKWETFEAEARRLWHVFSQLAEPLQVQRLGVRFINRISVPNMSQLQEYLLEPPTCPLGLKLGDFLYQSTFEIPGHDLAVKVVKTFQPKDSTGKTESALILDADAFTKRPADCDDRTMDDWLPKLRWLKNHVFFALLTPSAIESFQRN